MDTRVPFQPDSLFFQAVEEHRASNVNVEELEEHLPDVRHWDLPATVKNQTGRIFQMKPQATLVSNTSLAHREPVLQCILVDLLKDALVVAQNFSNQVDSPA